MILFILVAVVIAAIVLGIGAAATSTSGRSVWLALAAVIYACLFAGFYWAAYGTEETVTITVSGKERIAEDKSGKWVVYAAPRATGETFENTDALFHGKTNSTDLQRQLEIGKTYRCKVNGKRIGLFSSYRNLLSCEPAAEAK